VASLARGQVEILQFFRSRDAVVFTLALPVVLLGLLASIFSGKVPGTGVSFSQVYTTGLLAGGLASTSFLNLGITITGERENGTLKRLAGTPMPRAAYFLGKVMVVLVASLLEVGGTDGGRTLRLQGRVPGLAQSVVDIRLGYPPRRHGHDVGRSSSK